MFKKFINLEWKQFFRSSNFHKGLIINILIGIGIFVLMLYALGIGVALYFALKEFLPSQEPWDIVNKFLVFWFLAELIMRYFIQKTPILSIKPLLILPISRNKIIHYGLGKSMMSVFNFITPFIILPFSIVLIIKGAAPVQVIAWFFSVLFLSYSLNFITFLINKSDPIFYSILALLVLLIAIEYYHIYPIATHVGTAFNAIRTMPFLVVIPLFILVLSYYLSYRFMKKNLNLDTIDTKQKEVKTADLSWINRFGAVAPFLKNDLKLIWRNVRPRKTVLSAAIFLFYGLLFIKQREGLHDNSPIIAFAMMFVTGGFAMTFGQFVPSWDSSYYKLLMSQNIRYKTYLESKWYLMNVAVVISFLLATPYIYFGWKIYGLLVAGAFFNLGINSYLVLFGGVLNRKPVKLNEKAKAFGNTQGFSMTNFFIAIPKVILPIIMFAIPNAFWGFNAGIATIVGFSLIGVFLKNFFLTRIERIYQKTKYKTIAAFNENN